MSNSNTSTDANTHEPDDTDGQNDKMVAYIHDSVRDIKSEIGLLDSTFDDRLVSISNHTKQLVVLEGTVASVALLPSNCEKMQLEHDSQNKQIQQLQNQLNEVNNNIQIFEEKIQGVVDRTDEAEKLEKTESLPSSPVHHKSSPMERAMDTLQVNINIQIKQINRFISTILHYIIKTLYICNSIDRIV